MTAGRAALFLDRDGTIIDDAHYLSDASLVRLIPGAATAIARANEAGVPVVIVTNQSGIARGLITPAQYEEVRARTEWLLAAHGARVDATFHCPHGSDDVPPCDCRKPGLGMYRQAEKLMGIDLARSAYVGDRWRDVEPALVTGGLGLLVAGAESSEEDVARARAEARVHSDLDAAVSEALSWIASHEVKPSEVRQGMRIGVLASGGGSNLQALLDHFATVHGQQAGEIVLVASNRAESGALTRARAAGVDTHVVLDPANAHALLSAFEARRVELLVLAGYLKLVPPEVVREFSGRMLNVHPALLPAYGGAGMYGHRVHEAVIDDGTLITGVTVHFVDEEYDRGPIIAQWPVPVLPGDNADTLAARVLRIEHQLYPLIVEAVAARRIELGGDGLAHGHIDAILPPTAPEFRFALQTETDTAAPDGPQAFAIDVARLFPR